MPDILANQGEGGRPSPSPAFACIVGPTGSGKSALALAVAERLGGEIISCDSVQVYRGFDIGAAKPTADEQRRVPHHLIDVVDWHEDYDAARFARAAEAAIAQVAARGRIPLVVGGTGLYLRALLGHTWHDLPSDAPLRASLDRLSTADLLARLQERDPIRAGQLHPHDRVRLLRALEVVTLTGKTFSELPVLAAPPRRAYVVILDPPRPSLHRAIEARTQAMIDAGLLDEVRELLRNGVAREAKAMQSIGYLQCAAHLAGEIESSELAPRIAAATRQYAKRQTTWFRKTPSDERLAIWTPDTVAPRVAEGLASLG